MAATRPTSPMPMSLRSPAPLARRWPRLSASPAPSLLSFKCVRLPTTLWRPSQCLCHMLLSSPQRSLPTGSFCNLLAHRILTSAQPSHRRHLQCLQSVGSSHARTDSSESAPAAADAAAQSCGGAGANTVAESSAKDMAHAVATAIAETSTSCETTGYGKACAVADAQAHETAYAIAEVLPAPCSCVSVFFFLHSCIVCVFQPPPVAFSGPRDPSILNICDLAEPPCASSRPRRFGHPAPTPEACAVCFRCLPRRSRLRQWSAAARSTPSQ